MITDVMTEQEIEMAMIEIEWLSDTATGYWTENGEIRAQARALLTHLCQLHQLRDTELHDRLQDKLRVRGLDDLSRALWEMNYAT